MNPGDGKVSWPTFRWDVLAARTTLLMASRTCFQRADYITGVTLPIDGGYLLA